MLEVKPGLALPEHELQWEAVRAQGAGGQNVNKVASAIHLRFDVGASSLPEALKARLLARRDQRLTKDGVLVIKAQQFRTQEQNLADARERLAAIIRQASFVPRPRKATRPSRSAREKRVDKKVHKGRIKSLRGRVTRDH